MTEEKEGRRTSFFKKMVYTLLSIGLASLSGYSYARYIEPVRLSITEIPFYSNKLPSAFNGIKIAQFNDTHIGFNYSLTQFKKHLKIIQSYSPDLIIFTGDLLHQPNQYQDKSEVISLLASLEAPLGKFAVYGNHDHGGFGTTIYSAIMEESGFTILRNESAVISLEEEHIYLSGIDEPMLGNPSLTKIEQTVKADAFHIFLTHAPDLAAQIQDYDLLLSGHSHGGQIRLPLIGPLVVPPYAENFNSGQYEKDDGDQSAIIYVNRGLGTTRVPLRFMSVPEITMFTLYTKKAD
ncbi:metallophosphoesterase [Jeotgalibacillus sp. S-D1]|uniref:metallophosphoesterase n=1 Tax=Jeotgalibacillus sp. S-D1 TaxID=2552189 RepID=UPI00105A3038|nr:metallophosphoesterase [Jeotgalibacillus sp. S-D1]TDL35212.1 metallophosphoesterase [Jeotgalibacillus sp. S-D1]